MACAVGSIVLFSGFSPLTNGYSFTKSSANDGQRFSLGTSDNRTFYTTNAEDSQERQSGNSQFYAKRVIDQTNEDEAGNSYTHGDYGDEITNSTTTGSSEDEVNSVDQNATVTTNYAVTIDENDVVTINILADDRIHFGKDSVITIDNLNEPQHGFVSLNYDDTVTYTPFKLPLPAGSVLDDSFSYTASIGSGASHYSGLVKISIKQVNDAPTAYDSDYSLGENGQITFPLKAHDADGDQLAFLIIQQPEYGQITLDRDTGMIVYAPYLDFAGQDLLKYTVSDGISTSDPATIKLTIDHETEAQNSDTNLGNVEEPGNNDYYGSGQNDEQNQNSSGATPNNSGSSDENTTSNNDTSTSATNNGGGSSSSAGDSGSSSPAVKIDIEPGTYPNEINTNKVNETIPVAILGSPDLNVLLDLDESSLQFGPSLAAPTSNELVDINGDGFADFIGYYKIGELGLHGTDTSACQVGNLHFNGETLSFEACDSVIVVNQNNKG